MIEILSWAAKIAAVAIAIGATVYLWRMMPKRNRWLIVVGVVALITWGFLD